MTRRIFIAADGHIVQHIALGGCEHCFYYSSPCDERDAFCKAAKDDRFPHLPCDAETQVGEVEDLTEEEQSMLVTQRLLGEEQ